MSHFTTIKTKLTVKQHLLEALNDLNFSYEEGNVEIRGYQGQKTKVEVRVPTKNPGYDIGFRNESGSYACVADWYGINDINSDTFIKNLTQRYAYNAVKTELESQDFTFVEEKVEQDNTIRLKVRRMV